MTSNKFQLISDKVSEGIARNSEGVEIDLAPRDVGESISSDQIIYKKEGRTLTFTATPGHHEDVVFFHKIVIPRPLVWDKPNDGIKVSKEDEEVIIAHITEALKLINSRVYFVEMRRRSDEEQHADLVQQMKRLNDLDKQREQERAARVKTKEQLSREKRLDRFYAKEEKRIRRKLPKLIKRLEAGKLRTPTLLERVVDAIFDRVS